MNQKLNAHPYIPPVVCGSAHVLFTLFVFVFRQWCPTHILFCFCRVCLRLVYPMLPVSLDCFCRVCLRLVYPMLLVSLDCFCRVCLRLVYPMLLVSLDCLFLIAHSVFSNVYII